jgi:hypothetical protein
LPICPRSAFFSLLCRASVFCPLPALLSSALYIFNTKFGFIFNCREH